MINLFTMLFVLIFIMVILLFLFFTNPQIILYEIEKDNTIKKIKGKIQVVGNYIYSRKFKKVWFIPEGYQPVVIKKLFGMSKVYYVSGVKPVALKIENNVFKAEPVSPYTLGVFYENKIISDLVKSAKAEALNYKIILILVIALVGVIIAYFLFIAPNQVPKDAIPQLAGIVRNNASVVMP